MFWVHSVNWTSDLVLFSDSDLVFLARTCWTGLCPSCDVRLTGTRCLLGLVLSCFRSSVLSADETLPVSEMSPVLDPQRVETQLLLWDQFETFNTVKSFKASSLEQTHHSGCNAGVRTLCRRRRPNEPESSLIPVEQLMSEPSVSERRLVSNCGPAGNWSWDGNTEEGETLGAILKSGFGVAAN